MVMLTAVPQRWPYMAVMAVVSGPCMALPAIENGAEDAASSVPSAGTRTV